MMHGNNPSWIIRDAAMQLNYLCELFNLYQFNDLTNSYGNILDIFLFSKKIVNLNKTTGLFNDNYSTHYPLEIDINSTYNICFNEKSPIRNFIRADYNLIIKFLSDNKVSEIIDPDTDINCNLEKLMNLIHKSIELYVPYTKNFVNNYPTYFSKELKLKIKEKNNMHYNYKRFDDSDYYYNLFKDLRSSCKKLIIRDDLQYKKNVETNIVSKPTGLYNYIKSQNDKCDIPTIMKLDNTIVNNLKDTVNLFAKKFGSVYTRSSFNYRNIAGITNNSLGNIVFTEQEVSDCIDSLADTLSVGPDYIHILLIKNCKVVLLKPITELFNLSIKLGIYPDIWKKSFITPAFKNGDVHDVSNYRPIVKICILAKIFEKLVYNRLYRYVVGYIIDEQHGFSVGRSTITNLNVLVDDIVYNTCEGYNTDIIYTDFQRAFDKVDCNILMSKLEYYGIHSNLLEWFRSLLTGRTQRVRIENVVSTDEILVTSGVGQGSNLGSLLFLIYINDIKYSVQHSKFLLYADDLKLYKCIKTLDDYVLLQNDLSSVNEWCIRNNMILEIKKCSAVTYGKKRIVEYDYKINDIVLNRNRVIKDLGIYFDSALTFQNHVDFIVAKVSKIIQFLKRHTRDFRSVDVFRKVYFSYIYNGIMYGSQIWGSLNIGQLKQLEALNHKFFRFVAYRIGMPMSIIDHDYLPIATKLDIATINSAIKKTDLIYLSKIVNNFIDSESILSKLLFRVPQRRLRSLSYVFEMPYHLNNFSNKSVSIRICSTYNKHKDLFDVFSDSIYTVRGLTCKILNYN